MSKNSMKNKRQISKETTRNLILEKTKELIVKNGIIATSTKSIADYCKIAHGTLFSHFNTRETLIAEVLKIEFLRVAKRLYEMKSANKSLEFILTNYFELLIEEEELFVVVNKEFPFISDSIKMEIITTESIVKKLILQKIEQGISDGIFKSIKPTMAISFLFATLNYYLCRKEFFVESGSVIKLKKDEIINTFLTFIKK